ncbi:unnamed protein product, partial [Cylicostephanus goldi]
GFKVSVEHQLRTLSSGETVCAEVYETIKEAAQFMYQQYLSQEAITRVPLEDGIIAKFLSRVRNDEPCDFWFEQIQEKVFKNFKPIEVVDILRTDEHFYPGFKKSSLYEKMLAELGITGDDERPETPASDGSVYSASGTSDQDRAPSVSKIVEEGMVNDGKPVMSAVVETLGIGQQGRQSFALYNVRVSRSVNGKKVSGWNVLRRYSDFHTLHTFIIQKYPKLVNLSFPGKKTFNNLDAHFLEKRTKALNLFMDCVLQPSMFDSYPELESMMFDFLSQKEYLGNREPIAKKVMSAMFDPIKVGVKAVGNTVMAVPDQFYGGVSKESTSDNIPLRVLILFVDEVFGVRARNAWFRRQLVTVLRQFVTPFGTSINKRIVDLVHWLTSEQQVTLYLTALRYVLTPLLDFFV